MGMKRKGIVEGYGNGESREYGEYGGYGEYNGVGSGEYEDM